MNIRKLLADMTGQNSILTIPRYMIKLVGGDHLAAMLLSQLIYWQERTSNEDGWIIKSGQDWYEELFMSAYQVKRAITFLKKLDIGIETKKAKSPYHDHAPTLHYRINIEKLVDRFELEYCEVVQTDYEETSQSESEETSQSIEEVYTETTTETTKDSLVAQKDATNGETSTTPQDDQQQQPLAVAAQKTIVRHGGGFALGTICPDCNEIVHDGTCLCDKPDPFADKNANPVADDLCTVPPGNVVNAQVGLFDTAKPKVACVICGQDTPSDILVGNGVSAKTCTVCGNTNDYTPPHTTIQQRVASAKQASEAIKLDPKKLVDRDWAILGVALYSVNGNRIGHVGCLRNETERMGVFVAAGVLRALKRKLHYALTDDGREWVDRHIPDNWRESGITAQEQKMAIKRANVESKAKHRLQPPQPKGWKKVGAQIEPICDAFAQHWGKPATKTEHNRYVTLAWEFYNANGTPEEVAAIKALADREGWESATVNICATKLAEVRKQRAETTALPTAAEVMDSKPYTPGDPLANVAYFADEE